MKRSWREIRTEAEWRDMLSFTGLTPDELREKYGVSFTPEPQASPTTCGPTRHYLTLGLQPGVTVERVKSAYRALAMLFHPDRNPAGEERMKAINEAYAAICG